MGRLMAIWMQSWWKKIFSRWRLLGKITNNNYYSTYLSIILLKTNKNGKPQTLVEYKAEEQAIYNETSGVNAFSHYRYDPMTGNKVNITDYTTDYINGYRMGWKDAQAGKYYVDC
jgi:hypothetical protein